MKYNENMKVETIMRHAVAEVGSQSELARRLECSRQAVNQFMERGKVPRNKLLKFSEITGVPVELLLK